MESSNVASFTPIGVTLETIDILVRNQEMDAVALYMAFTAIAEWQKTHCIKATKSFMLQRTGWGKSKYEKAKATLVRYKLVENVTRKGESGKVDAWYVKVNHIVTTLHQNQEGGKTRRVENRDTSAFNTIKVLSTPLSAGEAIASRFNHSGAEIIKAFEQFNPACKRMYSNKTQREACDNLIEAYGLDKVLQVIAILPETNGQPFIPTITTPVALRDKWASLVAALKRHEREQRSNVFVV